MTEPWIFNRQPRHEWPAWLQERKVSIDHRRRGSIMRPESLVVHNLKSGAKQVLPGDRLELRADGDVDVRRASE